MTTEHPKYRPFPAVKMEKRAWPDRFVDRAPTWCSVDLRDGNQALATPMSVEEKIEFFALLVKLGFKEIEIGFPSASQIEFDFTRRLIEEKRIPDDVWVQVLVQSKEELIARTFESLQGAPRAIVHLYNSTSVAQRRIVFGLDKKGITEIAVRGARHIKDRMKTVPGTKIRFEYSPESFTGTEIDYALEVCEAVGEAWGCTEEEPVIFNLPATVELSTPNHYADMIEWFVTHQKYPKRAIISLHTHNDRGTGVAATELGLLAGATRVEGTLFGNGERTGNLDIVTVALNLLTQGVDPKLDLRDIPAIRDVYERCTKLDVPVRWPYSGDLVFTAFSGSHQDAINKGLKDRQAHPGGSWEVPYLAIDPHDIGRNYRAIIRINSQSGKGGVAYVMEQEFGYVLPKAMHRDFGKIVNRVADERGEELPPQDILKLFQEVYLDRDQPLSFQGVSKMAPAEKGIECIVRVKKGNEVHQIRGRGNGPIDAFVHGLIAGGIVEPFEVISYAEHSLGHGAEAKAVAYFEIKGASAAPVFGAGTDTNIEIASLKAVLSALNRRLGSDN
ncbi:MAG TPA: 2-isopropylmalate synthase [Candidatus Methylacidiphilales bacterium]|nr:2-isopropylmalate synthase [Candidatus Methylacidiphilales bacterium]